MGNLRQSMTDEEWENRQRKTKELNNSTAQNLNPSHYQTHPKEVYQMMIDIWGVEAFKTYCQINAFKYRMRAGYKQGNPITQDIQKALWYEQKIKEL